MEGTRYSRNVQFEDTLVPFFSGFGVDLLCEFYHGLEMRVDFFLGLLKKKSVFNEVVRAIKRHDRIVRPPAANENSPWGQGHRWVLSL